MNKELLKAFREWVETFPGVREGPNTHEHSELKYVNRIPDNWDGSCCGMDHVTALKEKKPDSKVCRRERAWRRYCTVRDGINHCVPDTLLC